MLTLIWHFMCQIFKEYCWSEEAIFPASSSLESLTNVIYWNCWGRLFRKNLHWYDVGRSLVCLNRPCSSTTRGVVMIVPGMNGDHKCHYVEQFVHDVAIPLELDVYVVKKAPETIGIYGDVKCISEGLMTLRERNLVSEQVKLGIVGVSAGAIPLIKYISTKDDIDYAIAIGCGFDLNKIERSLSMAWSQTLYHCVTKKYGLRLQDHDEQRALELGYHSLEHFYEDQSCHKHLKDAKVPLHIICAYDDPVVYDSHFAHVHQCAQLNPLIAYHFSRYGGHLGWRCGRWLRKTLLQEVYPYV